MSKTPNTDAIVKLAKEKSIEVRKNVEKTISEMALKNQKINFNSVAIKANVSKSWLYKNKDIRSRIEVLREQQVNQEHNRSKTKERSGEVIIRTFKRKIKELEKENQKLKKQLEKAYSQHFI